MVPFIFGFLVEFPHDKKYYIPAFISLSFFVILAVLAFFAIQKVNRKQMEKAKKIEDEILKKNRFLH
ncbi:hypothetical protein BpJC7_18820 [Weizmannia acidilactici]|uniref:Uncharacterized protein n=1 Tax=Weizmannia acidilactici TaxID=2607726 RepID=A0A5J4JGY0_9BACI|nr:hypothetical protein [Weizmannia acidilactici]GER68232.1 hypothetical protein BpJC4_27030 [Weizmannia acidilactici]GER70579.1 hypothetical protein BpJC7_18820 [Weizmannia acidilactici]GER73134.1 hypothetical protein BpPP18_12010 [Weizmannia acidilactici]